MVAIDNNFVLAREPEHKYILETLGELEAILRLSTAEELVPGLKSIIFDFKEKVEIHQNLEEKVIFLAALEALPGKSVILPILRLQREHGVITATIDSIIFKLLHVFIDDSMRVKISDELSQLVILIKKHSMLEIQELFPIISQSIRCKQLIDQYAGAFKN